MAHDIVADPLVEAVTISPAHQQTDGLSRDGTVLQAVSSVDLNSVRFSFVNAFRCSGHYPRVLTMRTKCEDSCRKSIGISAMPGLETTRRMASPRKKGVGTMATRRYGERD